MWIFRHVPETPHFAIYKKANGDVWCTEDASVVWIGLAVIGVMFWLTTGFLSSLICFLSLLVLISLQLGREPWDDEEGIAKVKKGMKHYG